MFSCEKFLPNSIDKYNNIVWSGIDDGRQKVKIFLFILGDNLAIKVLPTILFQDTSTPTRVDAKIYRVKATILASLREDVSINYMGSRI